MKKYSFLIRENINVWVNTEIIVEAESKEDIQNHIENKTLLSDLDCEFDDSEIDWSTVETLDYDYSDVTTYDMEEVE